MPKVGQRSVMAFDFGLRRIGVATGQELLGTGQPLAMIPADNGTPDWSQLEKLLVEWRPDLVLVGLPLNMDDTENDMCGRARKFGKRLHGRFHVPVEMVDERLTSYEAKGMVIEDSGHQNFGDYSVDGLAACLILESWMSEHPKAGD